MLYALMENPACRMCCYLLTCMAWVFFAVSVRQESRRFRNVLLLGIGLTMTWISFSLILAHELKLDLSHYLYGPTFLIVLASAGGFLVDGVIAIKKEGFSKFMFLPILAGLMILGLMAAYTVLEIRDDTAGRDYDILLQLGSSLFRIIVYVPFVAMSFALYSFLYQRVMDHHIRSPRWLVVLGCRVTEKGCPPLLRSRLDKAEELFRRTGADLIVSGGQGGDEPCSEASAMKAYLEGKGIPPGKISAEEKSRSTMENMLFSGEIMRRTTEDTSGYFITNNYHVLRSGFIACRAGLALHGIGSKTAGYYRPAATLREIAALIWSHRRSFLIYAGVNLAYTLVSVFFFC